jgi:hypothetical protein
MQSLLKTCIPLSRFRALCRVCLQIRLLESISQSQMIEDEIGPVLLNPLHACYINAFMQILFHILSRSLMILALPNCAPTPCKLRILFVAMSHHWLAVAISLSTTCEPEALDAKDCSELTTQILKALYGSSLRRNWSIIKHSAGFRAITRLNGQFPKDLPRIYHHFPLAWGGRYVTQSH